MGRDAATPAAPGRRGFRAFLRWLFGRDEAGGAEAGAKAPTHAGYAAGFAMSGTDPMAAAAAAFYSLPEEEQTEENARALGFAAGLGGAMSGGG